MRQASSWGSGSSTRWTQTCPPARGPPSSQMSAPWTQTIVSLTIILDISTMDLDNSKLTSVISSKQKNRSNNYKLTRKIVWFGYQMIIWMDIYYYQCMYNCECSRRGWVPVPGPHLHVRVQPQPEHRPHHHHHQAAPHLHGQRGLQGTTIKVVYITVISQLFYPFGYRALNTVPYCLKTLLKGTLLWLRLHQSSLIHSL